MNDCNTFTLGFKVYEIHVGAMTSHASYYPKE